MKQLWAKSQSQERKAHSNFTKFSVLDFEIQSRLETTKLNVQEAGGSKIMRAFIDHVKKFLFNPKTNGEPLKRLNE